MRRDPGSGSREARSSALAIRPAIILLILASVFLDASSGACQWTSKKNNATATNGAFGQEDPLFSPGILDQPAVWADPRAGDLYVFGGSLKPFVEPQSTLWRYNRTSGFWALLGGVASVGNQVVPEQSSPPWPAGTSGASVAQLPNGDAIVSFGKGDLTGFVYHTTVWRYSLASQSWTKLSGQSNATFVTRNVTRGVPVRYSDASVPLGVFPNSRVQHASAIDDQDRLWIYGGIFRLDSASDVWSFNLNSQEWTFWGGNDSSNTVRIDPVYTGSPDPGTRDAHQWVFLRGKLWMFGGDDGNCYADLWAFDTASQQWAFVAGGQNDLCLRNDSYPPGCTSPPCQCPSGTSTTCFSPVRDEFAMWTNQDDALFMYGGFDWAQGNFSGDLQLPWDSVWMHMYNVTSATWGWLAGSQGIKGVAADYSSVAEYPGGRLGSFFAYSPQLSLMYIYGGVLWDYSFGSDLWIAPLCALSGFAIAQCSPPTPPLPGSVCTSKGWTVIGSVVLPPGSTVDVSGPVAIGGGLTQSPTSVIVIAAGAGLIQSGGAVILNGVITVVLNSDPGGDTVIPLVNSNGTLDLGSQFTLVVRKNYTGCSEPSAKAVKTGGTLAALVSVSGCDSKKLATGAIVGIAVASAVVILVIAALLLVLCRYGRSNRLFSAKQEEAKVT